jgi:REP element-mobilizing transposase RayT
VARKPRIEFAGAIYHVLNRGNYRSDLFDSAGAAQAFVDCLFEACERMGWRLHAFCVMRNHYHLAVQTPQGNLVSGVHWLQSTFGNRFNRFRGEHGRAFQGRYQAILVEPGRHLANLVNYIHLNPARAHVVPLEQLAQFRWSSYRFYLRERSERPAFLTCEDWLQATSGLPDSPAGWRAYHDQLAWLMADDARLKEAAFDRMSRGWVYGGEEFQAQMLEQFKLMTKAVDWGAGDLADLNRLEWDRLLQAGLRALGREKEPPTASLKSAPWKIGLAAWLKQRSSVTNRWLTDQLHMGPPDAVSRYVSEAQSGQNVKAQELANKLTTKVRG